jgi:hypothetical protein
MMAVAKGAADIVLAGAALAASGKALGLGAGVDFEPLFVTHTPAMALAGAAREWFIAKPKATTTGANPWDVAHEAHARLTAGIGIAAGVTPDLIEPDLLQQWPHEAPARGERLGATSVNACVFEDQNQELPFRPARSPGA